MFQGAFMYTLTTVLTPNLPSQNYQPYFKQKQWGKEKVSDLPNKSGRGRVLTLVWKDSRIWCFAWHPYIYLKIKSMLIFLWQITPTVLWNHRVAQRLMGGPGFPHNTHLANVDTLPPNHSDWLRDEHMTYMSQSEPKNINITQLARTIGRRSVLKLGRCKPHTINSHLWEKLPEWSQPYSIIWTLLSHVEPNNSLFPLFFIWNQKWLV